MKNLVVLPAAVTLVLAAAGCSMNTASSDPSASSASSASPASSTLAVDAPAMNRPANVPPEFRLTPNGYFHPSCMHEVRAGERIDERGNIVDARGAARPVASCAYPHYDRSGAEIRPGARQPSATVGSRSRRVIPTLNGWQGWFASVVSNPTWVSASWVVPPAPYRHGSQTVYFFNGLEPSDGSQIVQPVLEWNQPGGSSGWAVSAWYVYDFGGNSYNSPPVPVNPGDTIEGYQYPFGSSWFIGMNVDGGYTTGLEASTGGEVFDIVLGGVLEAYGVDTCDELPDTAFEFFQQETVYQSGTPITPSWFMGTGSGTPDCSVSSFGNNNIGYVTWNSN